MGRMVRCLPTDWRPWRFFPCQF